MIQLSGKEIGPEVLKACSSRTLQKVWILCISSLRELNSQSSPTDNVLELYRVTVFAELDEYTTMDSAMHPAKELQAVPSWTHRIPHTSDTDVLYVPNTAKMAAGLADATRIACPTAATGGLVVDHLCSAAASCLTFPARCQLRRAPVKSRM